MRRYNWPKRPSRKYPTIEGAHAMKYTLHTSVFHSGARFPGRHYSDPGDLLSRHNIESTALRALQLARRRHGDCQYGGPRLCVDGHPALLSVDGNYILTTE